MAAQLEDGFTKIANEVLENISKAKLNGTQFRILLTVWRCTYGWNKKQHEISESYLSNATGTHKQQIKRELKAMFELGILTEIHAPTFNTTRIIEFNKRYLISSEVSNKIPVSESDTPTGSENDTPTGSGLDTQKRKINKDKEILCAFDEIWSAYPLKKGKVDVYKKLPAILKKYSTEEILRCITRYDATVKDKNYYLHGSTFFNGKYVDYLDENYNGQATTRKSIWDGVEDIE